MKRYPEYKSSGVPWLGSIPAHWEYASIKYLADIFNGSTPESGNDEYWDGDISWITPTDLGRLSGNRFSSSERTITEKGLGGCGTTLVPPGSLALSTRAPIGHVAIGDIPFCTNQGCRALVPGKRIFAEYFFYAIHCFKKELQNLGKGTTFLELATSDLADFEISVPPLPEQKAIAAYLGTETARIDTLLQEKEGLIGLLKEWRQSVIAQAVTKGLNKDAPMKASGVPWLGDIPVHWTVERLRFRAKLNPGATKKLADNAFVSFMPMEAIGDDGTLQRDGVRVVSEVSSGYTYFEDGDVAMAKITPCFENGKGAVMCDLIEGAGYGTTELIVMRLTEGDNPEWLYFLTMCSAFRKPGEALMLGAGGQKRVPDLYVKDYFAPIPTRAEQDAIVDFIKMEAARIDALIVHTAEEIDLLRELRAATIADAVLGRIDLRETTHA